MATSTSKLDICNRALLKLKEAPVSSIDSPTRPQEVTLSACYDDIRQSLLRNYVWNFAWKQANISRTGTPLFEFADAYQLPNDCLRVLAVGGDYEEWQSKRYRQSGRQIYINGDGANSIKLRYIQDVTDISQWDPLAKQMLVTMLALEVAYSFTGKEKVVERLKDDLARITPDAISVDGQEVPVLRIQKSKYRAARRNLRYANDGYWTYFPL